MSETVKVIELMGTSDRSWEHAAQNALDDAEDTLDRISGVKIHSQTANVENGQIQEYKTTLHVSFALER